MTTAVLVVASPFTALGACGDAAGGGDPAALIRAAVAAPRPVEPRLSTFPEHAPCDASGPVCVELDPGVVSRLMGAAASLRTAEPGDDRERLTSAAALDLVTSLATGNGTGSSVGFYRRGTEAAPESVAPWSDLAAAYLVRSRTDGSPADALWAVEAASRAVQLDSTYGPAAFNLALALEYLGLNRSAAPQWRILQRIDSGSGWATEAAERARRLATDTSSGGAQVVDDAGRARLLAMDSLLPRWGERRLAGDERQAADALRRAREIGATLAAIPGDRSVAVAVAEVGSDDATDRDRRLARGWVVWGRARERYDAGAYQAAAALFEEVGALLPSEDHALAGWLEFHRAASLIYAGEPERAATRLTRLVARTDARTFPALVGRATWGLGSIDLRAGRFETARARFREARSLFERAGELENAGATRYLAAEAGIALGQSWSAADSVIGALDALNRVGRESVWLHNLLYSAADHVRSLGLPRAALALQSEGVAVAERMGLPVYHAEARLARARLQLRMGQREAAAADLRQADSLLALIDDPPGRRWIANDRAHTASLLALTGDDADGGPAATDGGGEPEQLAAVLADVADFFADVGSTPRRAAALLDQARALREAGDERRERAVLGDVLRIGEAQVAATATFQLRASLAAVVRDALVRAVEHDLHAGQPAEALTLLSRWSGIRMGRPLEGVAFGDGGATGAAGVAYLLTDSATAIWVVRNGRLQAHRVPVERHRVLALLDGLGAATARGGAAIEPQLETLHQLLVAPVFGADDPLPSRLRIYAEGPLARVPFAALRDARTGRYLVEDAVVEYASTVAAAMGRASVAPTPAMTRPALVVAADAFDRAERTLPSLPWTRAEATAVATAYPQARLLVGDSATPSALRAAADGAAVLHFAGHAVLDAERPWQSRLVLAPDAASRDGALVASELTSALGGLDLVVLAACRSASPHQALSDGFTGFGDALLSAGVGATIGSIWDVPDRASSTLMTHLHEQYAAGNTPADALRSAQLAAIRSTRASDRHPTTWAGFRALVH